MVYFIRHYSKRYDFRRIHSLHSNSRHLFSRLLRLVLRFKKDPTLRHYNMCFCRTGMVVYVHLQKSN